MGPNGDSVCRRARTIESARRTDDRPQRHLPWGLVDAELFGTARNYPNAGAAERDGLIGAAHGGTLLLDEIGELPEAQQASMLRVLDAQGEYHRLGESQPKESDFRLCRPRRIKTAATQF